jgi:vitamin B12 transporter
MARGATSRAWGRLDGKAQHGGQYQAVDWYVGAPGGKRNDYEVGGGVTELKTSWKRYGATGALGVQVDPNHRFDIDVRTDGVYDADFRGSTANIYSQDDRSNRSLDLVYNGKLADGWASWML